MGHALTLARAWPNNFLAKNKFEVFGQTFVRPKILWLNKFPGEKSIKQFFGRKIDRTIFLPKDILAHKIFVFFLMRGGGYGSNGDAGRVTSRSRSRSVSRSGSESALAC